MQVLEHVYPNLVVLELTERLTVETEADLKDAVRRQLEAGRRNIVLDLGRVPYVDSCGLGTMVQAFVSAHRAGGWVRLSNRSIEMNPSRSASSGRRWAAASR